MNDYFDLDLYYKELKVSVKSSYFRIKERLSFVVYGKKGMFVKTKKDKQEEHLKLFCMPNQKDFGHDSPDDYGTLTYYDENKVYHEEKVISVNSDYGRYYDALYKTIIVAQVNFMMTNLKWNSNDKIAQLDLSLNNIGGQ